MSLIRRYARTCDCCRVTSPWIYSAKDSLRAARLEGWKRRRIEGSGAQGFTATGPDGRRQHGHINPIADLCPKCDRKIPECVERRTIVRTETDKEMAERRAKEKARDDAWRARGGKA